MPAVPATSSDHPATWKFDYPIYHSESRAQWRSWLDHNHATARGVWLCSWKPGTTRPFCPYPEAVEEAICFGWVDSTVYTLDVAKGNGWWTIYDPVEDLIEPPQLAAALDAEPAARSAWNGYPPSAHKMMLWWVISAVRDETKDKRIRTIVDKAAVGERAQG